MVFWKVLFDDSERIPLYLIHTIPLDSSYFETSLTGINISQPVILIDLPGHGRSPAVNLENINFENMADEIEKIRDDRNDVVINILGHGVGGFTVLYYALKYGSKINRIILSNTSANNKYRNSLAWNVRQRYSKITKQALENYMGKTDEKSIKIKFTQSLAVYFNPTNHEMAKKILDNCTKIATQEYVHLATNILPNYDIRESIRKIKNKTLIIAGKNDVWPYESVLLLQNDLIQAEFKLNEGGHFFLLENPEDYWSFIDDWLNTH
ncbi:MAG: alpha/beta hydrolase [Candidatus Heimdallarchaeota archaeon]|nr:alpha/beta hydrolase [Candidatus Heimdallarchaeota archaeon]